MDTSVAQTSAAILARKADSHTAVQIRNTQLHLEVLKLPHASRHMAAPLLAASA